MYIQVLNERLKLINDSSIFYKQLSTQLTSPVLLNSKLSAINNVINDSIAKFNALMNNTLEQVEQLAINTVASMNDVKINNVNPELNLSSGYNINDIYTFLSITVDQAKYPLAIAGKVLDAIKPYNCIGCYKHPMYPHINVQLSTYAGERCKIELVLDNRNVSYDINDDLSQAFEDMLNSALKDIGLDTLLHFYRDNASKHQTFLIGVVNKQLSLVLNSGKRSMEFGVYEGDLDRYYDVLLITLNNKSITLKSKDYPFKSNNTFSVKANIENLIKNYDKPYKLFNCT